MHNLSTARREALCFGGVTGRPMTPFTRGVLIMLSWALLFLIIALIAGALGLWRVQAVSSEIAWVLFVIFLILFVVSLLLR
jgi:uncharacterized membrane protein YtjA (UPF0391 family)